MNASTLGWSQASPLPLARAGYSAGIIADRYVVAGGTFWQGSRKVWSSRVDVFDSRANTWSHASSMPEPRADAAAATLDNALYVIGGGDRNTVRSDVIMLRGGAWIRLQDAALPEPRLYPLAITVGEYIYVLGGLSQPGDYAGASKRMWRWRPKSSREKWEREPDSPGPGLINQAAAVYREAIYIFGGAEASGRGVANCNSVLRFDCSTRRWSRLPDLPVARRCWSAVKVGNKVFLIGGYTDHFQADVFEYSLDNYSFRWLNKLPHPVCDAKFFLIGRTLVGAGGEIGDRVRGASTYEYELPPESNL